MSPKKSNIIFRWEPIERAAGVRFTASQRTKIREVMLAHIAYGNENIAIGLDKLAAILEAKPRDAPYSQEAVDAELRRRGRPRVNALLRSTAAHLHSIWEAAGGRSRSGRRGGYRDNHYVRGTIVDADGPFLKMLAEVLDQAGIYPGVRPNADGALADIIKAMPLDPTRVYFAVWH